jgi:hypothetical protein
LLPAGRHRAIPILLNQTVGLAAGLVGIRLASELVAPSDYGVYGLVVNLVPFGHGVVMAGLLKAVSREWAATTERGGLLRTVAARATKRLGWIALGAALAAGAIAPREAWWIAPALAVIATLHVVIQATQLTRQAAGQHWQDCGLTVVLAALRSVVPPLLYVATGWGLPALVAGFSVHAVVVAALCLVVLHGDWAQARPSAAPALAEPYAGGLFAGLAIAGLIVITFPRWLALHVFGAETGGYFGLAANVASIAPSMLGTMALQYFQPGWFAREHRDVAARAALARAADRVAALYAGGGLLATAALHALMPVLIGPLIDARYAAAAGFIAPAGCAMTAITTGYFYHAALLAARRERACARVDLTGVAALLAVALVGALAGVEAFRWALGLSPVLPWLVNRPLAHAALRRADA